MSMEPHERDRCSPEADPQAPSPFLCEDSGEVWPGGGPSPDRAVGTHSCCLSLRYFGTVARTD